LCALIHQNEREGSIVEHRGPCTNAGGKDYVARAQDIVFNLLLCEALGLLRLWLQLLLLKYFCGSLCFFGIFFGILFRILCTSLSKPRTRSCWLLLGLNNVTSSKYGQSTGPTRSIPISCLKVMGVNIINHHLHAFFDLNSAN